MKRALLLAGLATSIFASQAIWVTFSPAASEVASRLGVSEAMVGLLAIVYPVFFLALTIPSGILLDRSFKLWLSIGVVLTGLGGLLRLAAPSSYWWLMACQLLGALGQPFLLNAFAPFASKLYPERRELMVSLLSFAMYLGVIYALGTGYYLYTHHGLLGLEAPIALVSAVGLALYLAGAPGVEVGGGGSSWSVSKALRAVAGARDLWLLGIVLGLGVALFDNMSIWLATALSKAGLESIAGPAVALALILGLGGVLVIPTPVARRSRRTAYIRAVTLAGIAVYTALALETTKLGVATLIPLLGLLMLPAYPIIMEWITTFHPREVHGSASGFIGLVSRIFTVALASLAVYFVSGPSRYFTFLATLSVAAFAVAMLLPGDR